MTLHPDPKAKNPKTLSKERVAAFKQKCNAILSEVGLPITLYAATGRDIFRKPRPGMWTEFCGDHDLKEDVDLANSFFVGDAGGRMALPKVGPSKPTAKDFSCSDRNFAHNVGIEFKTPEEFFLGQAPREFQRDIELSRYAFPDGGEEDPFQRVNEKDVVIFCGPPGAGKSTFYWKQLKPLGYERINQDILGT